MTHWALLSVTGLAGRFDCDAPLPRPVVGPPARRADHDIITSAVPFDTSGAVGVVSSRGRAWRLTPDQLPLLPTSHGPLSLATGQALAPLLDLAEPERIVAFFSLDLEAPPLALGTLDGTVKRVVPEYRGWETWEVMAVKADDAIIGAAPAADADELVFISSDAQLLRSPARSVRAQGRQAGGMAGLKLTPDAHAIAFTAISRADRDDALVTTVAGTAEGGGEWAVKTTPFATFPAKGRATGGVRCQRFLKGQDTLLLGWAGPPPALACDADGQPRNLPAIEPRRDASGTPLAARFFAVG
jgi:DNA gyrase subunit A